MGGSGSGSRYQWWRDGKKTTVEACRSIDANAWTREGILHAGVLKSGVCQGMNFTANTLDINKASVRLVYPWLARELWELRTADYHVRLTVTRPRFGGLRWWFLCPLTVRGQPCERRVGKLYRPPGSTFFGCRQCHDLTYTSCQESGKLRAFYRMIAWETGQNADELRRVSNRILRQRRD